jgi:flagellar biosynthesis chaperone FliJ
MKRFNEFLTEADANLHMTHLEDAVIDGGVTGTRNVINYLRALRDMLSGNTTAPVSLTTKWDGAPAIFAGTDPSDGKFFVAKKGVFNKSPKLYKTNAEIDNDLSGELNSKFKVALKEFAKLGIEGVVQGDFLYTNDDLKTEDIDGESCVTFHPNTIVYAVPKTSDLGKKISGSKIGVVWHTTYAGSTLETMSASFGMAISTKLAKVKNVWHVDATFEDKSGSATMTKTETDNLTAMLSKAGSIFRTVDAKILNELGTNADLNQKINTFINSKVRDGQRIGGVAAFVTDLQKYIQQYYQKEADKRKTPAGKKTQMDKATAVLAIFDKKNKRKLQQIFTLYDLLVDMKYVIIAKLNTVGGIRTLLKTTKGFEVTGQEGFVAIDHYGKNALKIVDRMGFSQANFSDKYIKGWQK